MKSLKYYTIITILSIIVLFGVLIYSFVRKNPLHSPVDFVMDLPEIKERDTLIALTSTNHIDYFIYRGTPMGFQLELLEQFAKYLDVNLKVIVENDLEKAGEYLLNNKCDILAKPIVITKDRKQLYNFSEPIASTRQVLVQRMPDNYWQMSSRQIENSLIRSQTDLAEKTIYITQGSSSLTRLRNISDEIAGNIYIVEIDSLDKEQIIRYVSEGVFDYTITDEDIARLNKQIYRNIDVQTSVSFPYNLAWAVRKESEILLNTLDSWLVDFQNTITYRLLVNKYYNKDRRQLHLSSKYYSGNSGSRISKYDDLIKRYSGIINWDWRLLASLIYQESRFNPNAISWAGAFGIMQLMPGTAEELGIDSSSGVEDHIHAGARYIRFLDSQLDETITDSITRIKLILSGYNIGYGHVLDAIRLAEYYGDNPILWDKIQYYLINLTNPKYYNNEVVRNGYFPGIHGVVFANEIYARYMHYKNVIPDK